MPTETTVPACSAGSIHRIAVQEAGVVGGESALARTPKRMAASSSAHVFGAPRAPVPLAVAFRERIVRLVESARLRLESGRHDDVMFRRFGNVVAVRFVGKHRVNRVAVWEFLCDPERGGCGSLFVDRLDVVRASKPESCGCLRREVGG